MVGGKFSMVNILLVEDEELISEMVEDFLKNSGYQVTPCFDGVTAIELFEKKKFDLVILDIMIPGKNGIEVLREIRQYSTVPIIMLTARSDEQTQLISFNQQIDDYVIKPFSPTILVKRIENVLRKSIAEAPIQCIEFGELKIVVDSCEVSYKNKQVELTKKEFEILFCLIKNKNRILTREQIVASVWKYEIIMDTRIIDNHIRSIRKKIPELPIVTIKGIGYKVGNIK